MQLINKFLRPKAERLINYSLRMQRQTSRRGEYIFIASLPKTGSTFMAKALENLTGFRYVNLAYAYERNDQNLYLPKLVDAFSFGSVTHQHVRATAPNIELMNTFSIRPVILTRNIFDVVISIRDHMFNEGYAFPTFYCNEKFQDLDESSQLDQIIELGLPWYFNFYVAWYEASSSKSIETLWMKYEEVIADWGAALEAVSQFYGMDKSKQEITVSLEQTREMQKQKTRLNVGVSGRGLNSLTEQQKERIVSMARFYPWVDFSMIGIEKDENNIS